MQCSGRRAWSLALAIGLMGPSALLPGRDSAQSHAEEILPKQGLLLPAQRSFRRGGIDRYDQLEAYFVAHGLEDLHPSPGSTLDLGDGEARTWSEIAFAEDGSLSRETLRRGGYVYVPIASPRAQVMMLHASSHGGLFVNGVPHTSNVYGYGYYHIPVPLVEGTNGIVLRAGRKGIRFRLYEPPADLTLLAGDATLPDAVVTRPLDAWGAVIVANTTNEPIGDAVLTAEGPELETVQTKLGPLPPLAIRKVGFRLRGGTVAASEEPLAVTLRITAGQREHALELTLRRRTKDQAIQRTFVSQIDGSVQYFGLREAQPLSAADPAPALVLSCHGASVKGIGQAQAYSAKSWLHLVAPTNRRPYGFDWEDMGRADAMEVPGLAQQELTHDPSRIYLTGHSMGGHGTWHIGSLFPDRFAAIGPSAGWISYTSYARRSREPTSQTPIEEMLARGRLIGDPRELKVNLKHHGIYVLHGGDDDNVPARQAQQMAELLEGFHHDWVYHEEPGKRHWWSNDLADGGATCMDWPDMYDAFARHALPPRQSVRSVEFATANPGVSARCHWVTITAQQRHHQVSQVQLRTWPNKRIFQGTTSNVAGLRLDLRHLRGEGAVQLKLDGVTLETEVPAGADALWLSRRGGAWELTGAPPRAHKGPHRYGAIKNELRNRFVFVVGTGGNEVLARWNAHKARLDAENWWYRGNGAVDVIADADFHPGAYADRTIVLYGNRQTNSAWPALLGESPIQVDQGGVTVGDARVEGADLACLFVRPRPGSDHAAVIAIASTGPTGARLVCKQSLFQPFVRYPDCVVLRAPKPGAGRAQVETAGYFGIDWTLEGGEFISAPAAGDGR